MEKQNIKNYAIGIGISAILIIGITALIYRNEIYMWSLGDINSLYQQAEQHYKEKKYEEARKEYERLAKIDSAKQCQYRLGDMYFQGKGGEQDYLKARKYFEQSAESGNADAQNNLGYMYTFGIGLKTDFYLARKWLAMASAQGH